MAETNASGRKKRKSFTLGQKLGIINDLIGGATQDATAKKHNMSRASVQCIWKRRGKINSAAASSNLTAKHVYKLRYEKVDSALILWHDSMREQNIGLSGPMLLNRAKQFAEQFGYADFKASSGWLEKWLRRHGITISGESSSVTDNVVQDWIQNVWPTYKSSYSPCDIFNCDETGLFFKVKPHETYSRKGRVCTGGKLSKERVTVLLCTNMDGTEKLKPLVIGKSKTPRCMKGVSMKKLPVFYEHNDNSWMTRDIFKEWLRNIDSEFRVKKRKILLVMDNAPVHKITAKLSNITIAFLPPNTTSKLQPCNAGILGTFKRYYRTALISEEIDCIESGKSLEINILKAIMWTSSSWLKVPAETILKCWKHVGLGDRTPGEDYTPVLEEPLKVLEAAGLTEDYLNVDSQVLPYDVPTVAEIIAQFKDSEVLEPDDGSGQECSDDEEADGSIEAARVKNADVRKALNTLRIWIASQNERFEHHSEAYGIVDKLENIFESTKLKRFKQSGIFDDMSSANEEDLPSVEVLVEIKTD